MMPLATVAVAMTGGALRVTPFLFVSLGECLTERSGRIKLGNEGVLVLVTMVAYATSYQTGNPCLGVLAAALVGAALGSVHGAVCALPRVIDSAMGIAIMLAGTGLAFFFGKPYIQPSAPSLPSIPLGLWAEPGRSRARCGSARCSCWALPRRWRCTRSSAPPASVCGCGSWATTPTRRWHSGCRRPARGCSPPPAAAPWPASDGTKSFGFEEHLYPPCRHDNEDLCDHHVAAGTLYKVECLEPFNPPLRKKDGRVIEGFHKGYYTRSGQEWRVRASKLLWSVIGKHPWDERCERLQGMLFGYEEWQTEWWLSYNRERGGGWSGLPIYCGVSEAQLASIEAVGFRAFPPVAGVALTFAVCGDPPSVGEADRLMGADAIALVRATISGRLTLDFLDGQNGPNIKIARGKIPKLNRTINGFIEVVARRDGIGISA